MHESHLRAAVDGRLFTILYCQGQHVEMCGLSLGTDYVNRRYFLTVTAQEDTAICTESTIGELALCAESLYLSVRDWEPNSNSFVTKVAELELLQPDGSLIPSFADIGVNVVSLRKTA